MPAKAPSIAHTSFNCVHCGVLAAQQWFRAKAEFRRDAPGVTAIELAVKSNTMKMVVPGNYEVFAVTNLYLSECSDCRQITVWHGNKIIYPLTGEAYPASPDMPPQVRANYDEASAILAQSPKGATALLRLALEQLCHQLTGTNKKIDECIGLLAKRGIDEPVRKAMDVVRVSGNEAVHPGQIDERDDRASALTLFRLINIIVERTISQEREIDELYSQLPSSKIEGIDRRDNRQAKTDQGSA